jgi:uncharacterized membrane protein
MHGKTAITVNRPPAEVYRYWHDFAHLPDFMTNVASVEDRGGGRWHWRSKAKEETRDDEVAEWDIEIVTDEAALIAWRSVAGSDLASEGTVRFAPAPGDRGTEVVVELDYQTSEGKVASLVKRLLGEEPGMQLKEDLRRFKQVLEAGEVLRSDGSPEGANSWRLLHQRPARPLSDDELGELR